MAPYRDHIIKNKELIVKIYELKLKFGIILANLL